jgi:hypothetical protein
MILSDTPTNEAILSNVGAVSEFTIKATAKSFRILSDGLYANKIRAIIREVSCNALDSHVANGNTNVPFVVHLPNSMEPFFSVRDFGTGLSADQVTSIFTSFFTSTKTGSNDFIGALGLGSKSPFSYTDNFTVTAVKDGVKGIYTAFINEFGVPSIALMMSEATTEPSGVEIKFAVNDHYDFGKFRDEARYVFKYWKNRPTITGNARFEFSNPTYKDQNIVPGVHSLDGGYGSVAIMGNIAYPIEVPSADTGLAQLRSLLDCGLVIEFGIGELDFQASREGLSYVPLTINSIKAKLETLNAQLAVHLAAEADKIENLWERSAYLYKRMDDKLWSAAVHKYVTDTKFPLLNTGGQRWNAVKVFNLPVADLATKFNISIKGFMKSRGSNTCQSIKADLVRGSTNTVVSTYEWQIRAEMDRFFVFNDTKVGAFERAKFHWRNQKSGGYTEVVYVLEPVDRTLPMKQAEFLAEIMNPPANHVMMASTLMVKERAGGLGRNVSILRLESRSRGYRYSDTVVWTDAGKADQYDAKDTHYYIPLSGYKSLGKVDDTKALREYLTKSGVYTGTIYGVRRGDIEAVKAMKNWVELDTLVESKLAALGTAHVMGIVKQAIGFEGAFHWRLKGQVPATSPYMTFATIFKDVKEADGVVTSNLQALCRLYKVATATTAEPTALIADYQAKKDAIMARYPLLSAVSRYSVETKDIAEYINMVDTVKPV